MEFPLLLELQTFLEFFPNTQRFRNIPLKVLGCSSFVHIHSHNRGKVEPRDVKCIFLGYSPNQKGYKCYSPLTNLLYTSMDVMLFEEEPFYPTFSLQGETISIEAPTLDLSCIYPAETLSDPALPHKDDSDPGPYISRYPLHSNRPLQVFSRKEQPHLRSIHDPMKTQHVQECSSMPDYHVKLVKVQLILKSFLLSLK